MNNITVLLYKRQYSKIRYTKRHFKIIRSLILKNGSQYRKVSKYISKQLICYECGMLYMNNFRECYSVKCCYGRPRRLYTLPQCPARKRIIECLVSMTRVSEMLTEPAEFLPSLYALTENNYLYRYALESGKVLSKVYLSSTYKFKHINWNVEEETFLLRSTRMPNRASTILMAVALFSVAPFKLKAMIEIRKKIFDPYLVRVLISHDLLLTMHKGGKTNIYSLTGVLKNINTNVSTSLYGKELACNVVLTECPPLLFSIVSEDHYLVIGSGDPWRYITSPLGAEGKFQVWDMRNKQQVGGGILDFRTHTVTPDRCYFHSDDSGRIIHMSAEHIRLMKFDVLGSGELRTSSLTTDFTLQSHSTATQEIFPFTSTGRRVSQKTPNYCESNDRYGVLADEVIQAVDYENELDLIAVGTKSLTDDDQGYVTLYDNWTGQKLKEILTEETWDEDYEHTLSMDLDTLIHIHKDTSGTHYCNIYQLDRHSEYQDISCSDSKAHRRSHRRSHSRYGTSTSVPCEDITHQDTRRSRRLNTNDT